MKKEIKHPDKAVNTGAYSAGVLVANLLFVSGQGPIDLLTGEVLSGSIEEEVAATMLHVKKILEAAGGSLDDIVKCTVHLKNIEDFEAFDAVYATFFKGVLPARTTVQSVLYGGIKVEIDAIAKLN